jgi:2-polyprenyl-3-methyl-5-hydroxy-6-metoxy-1,4-benzoquinol methylase
VRRFLLNRFNAKISSLFDSISEGCSSALDIGCGEGFVINLLKTKHPALEFSGCDIDKDAIEIAQRLNPNVNFWTADAVRLESKDSYDIVICTEVLEHLESPEAALEEIYRIINDVSTVKNNGGGGGGNIICTR